MTTGEYIKVLRSGNNIYGRKWTQAELGAALNPPVNRAAVNKWETGLVKNLKRTHILQMATMFGVTPNELMCFDDQPQNSNGTTEHETPQIVLDKDATQLLLYFLELNDAGKAKILEEIQDLAEHPKYQKQQN